MLITAVVVGGTHQVILHLTNLFLVVEIEEVEIFRERDPNKAFFMVKLTMADGVAMLTTCQPYKLSG